MELICLIGKKDRYEYFFYPSDELDGIRYTGKKTYGVFFSLGSQGWRYVNTVDGFHIFERKSRW